MSLLADDRSFIRPALDQALASWGYELFEADTVASTIEMFREAD